VSESFLDRVVTFCFAGSVLLYLTSSGVAITASLSAGSRGMFLQL
jgi:hypothetical protein